MTDEAGWEEARSLRAEAKRLKDNQDLLIIAVGTMIQAHEELARSIPFERLGEPVALELNALLEKHEVVVRNAQQAIRGTRPNPSEPHATV